MTSIYPSSTTSSSSSTSSANLLRISGMASGIDTDSVVKSMVSSYQTKIDKASQDKQLLQWKQDAYRDIIKGIKGLQDYFDPLSSKYIMGSNSLDINTASSDDTSVLSATAGSTAKAGTYNVVVNQLATQAQNKGSSLNTMVSVADVDASKWSKATLKLGSTSITLDAITDTNSNGTTLDEIVANINGKISANSTLNGTVSASYVNDGGTKYIKFTSTSATTLTATTFGGSSGDLASNLSVKSQISSNTKLSDLGINSSMSFNLSYDSTTTTTPINITAATSDTLQNLIDEVNSKTSGAVTMSVDSTSGKILFSTKNYGSTSSLKITDSAGNLSSGLGITAGSSSGTDAIVAIKEPGQSVATTTTQSSNKFTINGVSYNLVGVNTTSNADSNITVAANTDDVVKNIKSFITDYNTIVSTINTKLTEKKNSDYQPLTDSQKESMSDSQITAWETKAKVGILRNDDYLSQLMTQLRGVFSSPVYSSYNSSDTSTGKISLSFGKYGTNAIGIDTSSDYTNGGQLVISDESKLKSAIENNFDDFKKLFTGASSTKLGSTESYVGSKKYNEDGLLKRMDTVLRNYVADPGIGEDGTYTLSGTMNIFVNKQYDSSAYGTSSKNTLPDQLYGKTLSISKLKTQMSDAETRYYNKFTALETAMNSLNSQQSQLSSMLG